jgi:butyrate kinase
MKTSGIDLASALILAIYPQDFNTQLAVYRLNKPIFLKRIRHSPEDLAPFKTSCDQAVYRKELILDVLKENDIPLDDIKIIMGRGGLIKPVRSGIYEVNERIKEDLRKNKCPDVINLGGLLADSIAIELPNAKAFIADPIVVDEFEDIARISGHPLLERKSIFHALNQKTVAREHAKSLGRNYEEMNLIVVNLGRGITVGAHYKGHVTDSTQGFDGDGPFSPICSGTLPMGDIVRMCFSGKYTEEQMLKMIRGEGGMKAYLDTESYYEVEKRIEAGDKKAKFIFEAMAYQVAKSIGGIYMVFQEEIDGILITGDLANSKLFVNLLTERISKIGQVILYPGDEELEALAKNGLMLLKGERKVKEYK